MESPSSLPPAAISRIAVFRALYLGDLILAIPALRSLRAHFAEAEITLIGLPWARDFIRRFGYVDRFLQFPGFAGIPEVPADETRTRAFLEESRAYGYDLAIQMHGNGTVSNRFVANLGAKHSAGYSTDGKANGVILSMSLPYEQREHEIVKCLRLAQLVGAKADDTRLEFPVNSADEQEAQRLIEDSGRWSGETLVGLHIGAKHPAKRWPAERWAALAAELASVPGVSVILTGTESEEDLVARVERDALARMINLAGRTSLGGLAALIARMRLFIAGDTGPAHLAIAVGTRSITIFGPTDPQRWGPLNRRLHRVVQQPTVCSPCADEVCPTDQRCLTNVSVDEVMVEAIELLSH